MPDCPFVRCAVLRQIIASEAIQAYRKDVLAKCYGGDISRKKKLLAKQARCAWLGQRTESKTCMLPCRCTMETCLHQAPCTSFLNWSISRRGQRDQTVHASGCHQQFAGAASSPVSYGNIQLWPRRVHLPQGPTLTRLSVWQAYGSSQCQSLLRRQLVRSA